MQYILSEEEYHKLKEEAHLRIERAVRWQQELCTKICNTMPIDAGWRQQEPSPWMCILGCDGLQNNDWYCDHCPVQDVCPYDSKEYSK